jgi:hypothetical protein
VAHPGDAAAIWSYDARVHVEIGPVPAESALEYVKLAREQLALLGQDPGDLAATLTPFVLEKFEDWVDEWEAAARSGEKFHWSADLDPEVIEHTFYAFFLVVQRINDTYGSEGPPGDIELRKPFRLALTRAVLDALETEGDSFAEFARHLREYWPDEDFEDRTPLT